MMTACLDGEVVLRTIPGWELHLYIYTSIFLGFVGVSPKALVI